MRMLNNYRRTVLFGLLFFALAGWRALSAQEAAAHPRLILTPSRIAALKSSLETTHRDLWEVALQTADEFSREAIPEMAGAHNRYRRLGDTLPALGLAFLVTGETRYLESAEAWLSALLSVPEWNGSANLGRSSWAIGCALLYDWLYDVLDTDLRSRIREKLLAEAEQIVQKAAYHRALSNHLLIETTALGMVGLAVGAEAEETEAFLDQADEWVGYIIGHAPLDGSWGEGVLYWQYGLSHFLRFLEASRTAGHKDYYPEYDWLKITGFFPIYFSLPGRPADAINISDSHNRLYIPKFILYHLASVNRNGYYQDYGNKISLSERRKFSWMDFIAYDPTVAPVDIGTLPTLKHFTDNDFVTMRSGWDEPATAIGFRCGPAPGHRNQNDPTRHKHRIFGPGHGHPDINSFCLFAYGEWLAIDPGYTLLKLTRNHNTVIVNGCGQAGAGNKWLNYQEFGAREPAPAILRVESNSVYDYVLGDAGNIYIDEARLKSFRRHLLFLKPDIVVIADELEGKENARFEWLLNARRSIKEKGKDQFEIIQNGVRLWVQPLLPEGYKARIQERELDASKMEKIVTLDLAVDAVRRVRYLVVLCALEDSRVRPPEVSFEDNVLSISHRNHSWTIAYREKTADAADPILIVEKPQPEQVFYQFVRP